MAEPAAPPLGLPTKIGYGVGAVAFGVGVTTLSGQVLQLYFNQVVGAPAVWVGTALMISTMVDAVFDPMVGRWSDNLRSPFGRRHTFMYASAIPAALGFILMWHAPAGLSTLGLFAFMTGLLLFVRLACSLFEIPSLALAPELAPTYDDRTSLLAWRFLFLVMGGALASGVLYLVFLRQDAANPLGVLNRDRYTQFGWVAAALMFFAILASALSTHRRIRHLHVPPVRSLTLSETLAEVAATFRHRPLAILMVTNLLIAVAAGVTAGLGTYLYLHFWRLKPQELAAVLFFGPFASFLALGLTPAMAKRFGKKPTMLACYGSWLLTATVPMGLNLCHLLPGPGTALIAILTGSFFLGVGFAVGCHIVLNSMLSDASEDVAVKTGRRSEGVLFAAYGLMAKVGDGLGAFVAGLLLTLVHFPAKAMPGTVDPGIVRTLVVVNLPVIAIFNLCAIACVSFYRLDRAQHEANLAELRRREALAGAIEINPSEPGAPVVGAAAIAE